MIEGMTKEQAVGRLASLDATKPDDVRFLAEVVDGIAVKHHPVFAAAMLDRRLMGLQGFWVRTAVWLARKSGVSIYDAMMKVFAKAPEIATETVEATSNHIAFGRDKTTPGSAGGWNQDEINTCAAILLVMAGVGVKVKS